MSLFLTSSKSFSSAKYIRKSKGIQEKNVRDEKKLITNLTEKQIDKFLEDSFPASDPTCIY